ncbi:MAG: TonB-dependent receptor [Pseudoxanthomonas sp.]
MPHVHALRHKLRLPLALAIAAAVAGTANADDATIPADTTTAAGGTATSLDTVVVTGARASGRTVENSAVPIDVISSDQLRATGKGNLLQALQQVLPSFNVASSQSDVENNIPGAQLRRLSPGYTLVLVNGKRRNVSAYVSPQTFPGQSYADLSLIPVTAIDHVEVLRDGASAIYGSDAIAGVFNVILKSDTEGGSVGVEWGQTYEGDGERQVYRFNKGFGLGGGRGFVNVSGEYTKQNPVYRTLTLRPDVAIYPLVDDDGNYLSKADYKTLLGKTVSITTNSVFLPKDASGQVSLPDGVNLNPLESTRDSRILSGGDTGSAAYETPALALNLDYDLTDNLNLYAFATYSQKKSSARFGIRTPLVIWANNPALLDVFPNGFSPTIDTDETDYSGVVGSKGALGGWDYDLSAAYNHDGIDLYSRNTVNFGQVYTGAPGSVVKTDFHAGRLEYDQFIANFDLHRDFEIGWLAKPLQLSVGTEYQREHYVRAAGDPDGYYAGTGVQAGAQSYPSNRPEDADDSRRHSEALYVGLATNITDPWYVDLAARYEDHSDFGSVSTGRLSTRFDFNDHVAVRATVSNGFHAPSLGSQNFQITKVTPSSSSVIASVNSSTAAALGATPLKPEKSLNYSVGLAFNWNRNLKVAVDAYQIRIKDQLGTAPTVGYDYSSGDADKVTLNGTVLTAQQKQQIDDLLATAGASISPGENKTYSYYTNIGDFTYRGVEATIEDAWELGADGRFGRLRANYAVSTGSTKVDAVRSAPDAISSLPLQPVLTQSYYFSLRYKLPKLTQILTLDWSRGPWNVSVNEVYNGKIRRSSSTIAGGEYTIGATWVTNLSARYGFGNGLDVELGASNLFDRTPDELPAEQIASTYIYTTSYADGTLSRTGGYYYARLNYNF